MICLTLTAAISSVLLFWNKVNAVMADARLQNNKHSNHSDL